MSRPCGRGSLIFVRIRAWIRMRLPPLILIRSVMEQGIFTGKGIFDVDIFAELLGERIPENTVLSHDLLEGGFLRAPAV